MKDKIKLILELISFGKAIFKEYKKVKDVRKKKAVLRAIEDKNSKYLRKLLFDLRK